MEKVDLPQWASDGTSDIRSDRFADLSKTLDVTISALSTADRLAAGVYGPAVMDELLRLYGRARDLVRTLLTMSRAHLDVNPTDGDIVSVRSRLFARRAELERGAKNVLAALVALPKPGDDPETDRHYETYSELLDWKKVVTSLDPVWEKKNENAAWLYDAMTPLHAMHTHLTSTMALEVEASGRHVRRQSFGMSLIVLRNSDDWVLRRSTFEAMNAWFASHANAFADLLNAICGVRVGLWKTTGASFPDIHLRHERTSPETYRALWQAVDLSLIHI